MLGGGQASDGVWGMTKGDKGIYVRLLLYVMNTFLRLFTM